MPALMQGTAVMATTRLPNSAAQHVYATSRAMDESLDRHDNESSPGKGVQSSMRNDGSTGSKTPSSLCLDTQIAGLPCWYFVLRYQGY